MGKLGYIIIMFIHPQVCVIVLIFPKYCFKCQWYCIWNNFYFVQSYLPGKYFNSTQAIRILAGYLFVQQSTITFRHSGYHSENDKAENPCIYYLVGGLKFSCYCCLRSWILSGI